MYLKAKKPVFILGQWWPEGSDIPDNLIGVDYEKMARKDMIEEVTGAEIKNVTAEPEGSLPEEQSQTDDLLEQLKEAKNELDQVRQARASLEQQLDSLKVNKTKLKGMEAELAEYHKVIGPLIPPDKLSKKLRELALASGYYTLGDLSAASDEELLSQEGWTADGLKEVRAVAPAPAPTAPAPAQG